MGKDAAFGHYPPDILACCLSKWKLVSLHHFGVHHPASCLIYAKLRVKSCARHVSCSSMRMCATHTRTFLKLCLSRGGPCPPCSSPAACALSRCWQRRPCRVSPSFLCLKHLSHLYMCSSYTPCSSCYHGWAEGLAAGIQQVVMQLAKYCDLVLSTTHDGHGSLHLTPRMVGFSVSAIGNQKFACASRCLRSAQLTMYFVSCSHVSPEPVFAHSRLAIRALTAATNGDCSHPAWYALQSQFVSSLQRSADLAAKLPPW